MQKKLLLVPITIFIFLLATVKSTAQIKTVKIGVNGLTCSACCRTVEMSIRKLSFVKDVKMNLENTSGEIFFTDGADVDVEKIAKAITNAGFSVRFITASFLFSNLKVSKGFCFNAGKYNLQFINATEKVLNGVTEIKFVGQQFQPKGEFNKVKSLLVNSCNDKNEKIYFVTL